MSEEKLLEIDGLVEAPQSLALADFTALPAAAQIADVSTLDPKRQGSAVRFVALLNLVRPQPEAQWLGLHSSADNFHASIPLAAVRERAIVIYALAGAPLPAKQGGPVRFFIPDYAACKTHEIDECANVKFIDRMEFTATRGFDNRPHDAEEHEKLHQKS